MGIVEDIYIHLLALRMAMHIGQALLQDAKQGGFDLLQKSRNRRRQVQLHFDFAPSRKTLHVPSDSRQQPALVKQRWMQQMGHGSGFRNTLVHELRTLLENFLSARP